MLRMVSTSTTWRLIFYSLDFCLFWQSHGNKKNGSSRRLIYFPRIGRKWKQNYQSHLSNPPGKPKKQTNINKQKTKRNTATIDREVLTDHSILWLPRSFYTAVLFCRELYEVSYFPAMPVETRKDRLAQWTVSRADNAEVMVGRESGALSRAVLQSNVWITGGEGKLRVQIANTQ